MTIKKNGLKRATAIILVLAALLLPLNGVQPVLRTEAVTENYIIPSVADGIISQENVSGWWGSFFTVKDIDGFGGISYSWDISAKGVRQGIVKAVPLDGLTMYFDNLSCTVEAQRSFAILISNHADDMDPGNSRLINESAVFLVDTQKGRISFENDAIEDNKWASDRSGTVLLESELLKYNNLKGKEFSIAFAGNDTSGYTVTLTVGDSAVTGKARLTAEMLVKVTGITDKSYLFTMLSSWDGSRGVSIDYKGLAPCESNDTCLTVPSLNNAAIAEADVKSWWGALFSLTELPTGGLHYAFTGSFRDVRNGVKQSVLLDGMRIRLDNIKKQGTANPIIAFSFSNTDTTAECKDGNLIIALDTSEGAIKLFADKNLENGITVKRDERLLYKNVMCRQVVLRTLKNTNGSYKIIFYVGSQAVEAMLSLSNLNNTFTGFTAGAPVYVALQSGYSQFGTAEKASFSFDFLEIGTSELNAAAIDEKITELNSIRTQSAEKINEVYDSIKLLARSERLNLSKLALLEDIGERLKNAEKNSDSFLLPMNLTNARLSSSEDTHIKNTLKAWEKYLRLSETRDGVLHYEFTSSIVGVREGCKGYVGIDGLKLQFDNLEVGDTAGQPAIYLQTTAAPYGADYNKADPPLALVLVPEIGAVDVYPLGERIILNNSLTKHNLCGKRFSVEFCDNENGGYTVAFKVDDEVITGEISSEVINAATALTDSKHCSLMLSNWKNGSSYSIDFVGIHTLRAGDADNDGSTDITDLVRLKKAASNTDCPVDMDNMGKRYTETVDASLLAAMKKSLLSGVPPELKKPTVEAAEYIDNSKLIPEILPDSEVTVDESGTPDWASTLIMGELRIATATEEGTLKAAVKVLDHYAEAGINGIWITPIFDPGKTGNGYGNLGVNTVDPKLTGTDNYDEGLYVLRDFVAEAHRRNIRIFLDIVTWGTTDESPLYTEHSDWFLPKNESKWYPEPWGPNFDWSNEQLKAWFKQQVINIAETTGCDGFRCDMEPGKTVRSVFADIKNQLLSKGKKLLFISEDYRVSAGNDTYGDCSDIYDCEQWGVTGVVSGYYTEEPIYFFLDKYDLTDSIKNGNNIGGVGNTGNGADKRFYINPISNHDNHYPVVCGNRLAIGYQAIYSPFIPLWYLGEEWNNSRDADLGSKGNVLFYNTTHWDELESAESRAFFEDVKAMIRVRRLYPEVFASYSARFKDSNIAKLDCGVNCSAYARYTNGSAVLILPNYSDESTEVTFTVPKKELGVEACKYFTVTDAETGEILVRNGGDSEITVRVDAMDQRAVRIYAE